MPYGFGRGDFFPRQRRKRRAFCLAVTGFVSPPIRQALADDALEQLVGAGAIIDAKGLALVVAEVEFGEIALQVLRRHVVVRADDPALEDRKEVLNRVGVVEAARADVFFGRVPSRMASRMRCIMNHVDL